MSPHSTKRRAMLVGPAFHDYNGSIARALQAIGFETHVFETPRYNPEGLINRVRIDLASQLGITHFAEAWGKQFNKKLLDTYRALSPDLVLIIKGRWIAPETLEAMNGATRALWFQDAAANCTGDYLELARAADHVFVFEGSDVEPLRQHGIHAHFLPMGFDPQVYRPLPGVKKDIDITFVGFPYHNRVAIFQRLIQDFPKLRIRIVGRYLRYREPRTYGLLVQRNLHPRLRHIYRNREISPELVNRLYARSKIVLNIHSLQSAMGCNPRVFELIGAGACQVVDAIPYLRDNFESHLPMFEDYEQLKQLVVRFTEDEVARTQAAELEHSIKDQHSFEQRVRQLLAISKLDEHPQPALALTAS